MKNNLTNRIKAGLLGRNLIYLTLLLVLRSMLPIHMIPMIPQDVHSLHFSLTRQVSHQYLLKSLIRITGVSRITHLCKEIGLVINPKIFMLRHFNLTYSCKKTQ